MESFGKICFAFLVVIITILISGFILMKMWAWFMVPVFSLPEFNLYQAIGVSTFLSYIKGAKIDDKEKEWSEVVLNFIKSLIYTGALFILAYLIHLSIS